DETGDALEEESISESAAPEVTDEFDPGEVIAGLETEADLSAEHVTGGYPDIDADSVKGEAPVSPSMSDDGATYWAESLDSEEKPFEPQGETDTLDKTEDDLGEEPISESAAPEETDEFDPGEAITEPEVDVLGDEVDQLVPIDGASTDADTKESEFPEVDLVEIETEAEKTEIDEERESFEPGTVPTHDESFQGADEVDTTPSRALDRDELPADSGTMQHPDEEEPDFPEEKIEEVETGEAETPMADIEMRTGEQEQAKDIKSGEDSFEPAPKMDEDQELDTDDFVDTEGSTPTPEHEEPYSPDIQTLVEDMKDIHLDEADRAGEATSEEVASDESESEIDLGEQLSSEELKTSMAGEGSEESEAFEPGSAGPEASAPESMEQAYTGSAKVESDEDVTFEPGQRAEPDEPETKAVGKDHDTAKDVHTEEGELPEVDAAESELSGPVASPPEVEEKPKDQFEPGELASGETATVPDEGKPVDTQETVPDLDEREWDAEPTASKASIQEGDLPDIAILREEQHRRQEEVPSETRTEEEGYLEKETISAQDIEGQDSASSTFTPGESPPEKDEAGLSTPDSHAAEEDVHAPYAPDLSAAHVSSEDDLEVLEKAAYDSREMRGESFEPSTRVPTLEDEASESEEDTGLTLGEDEETEPVLEEDRGDVGEGQWLDPKLATFTLATIYKVQGLYQQALQVLDLLEDKGADSDRIAAERDAILHQMGSPSSDDD
ncbi:hypothetical protein ACFL45_01580, partial [Candidatus Neomarinimicrobiota bacterium]